jgi:hypothetical protein
MNQDLTPNVMHGLGWYYLLAALLNAGATAYVGFMEMVSEGGSTAGLAPKTRKFPSWLGWSLAILYTIAAALILGKHFIPGAILGSYFLFALGNVIVALTAAAEASHFAESKNGNGETKTPSLDDHVPAVGIGGPMNRTLWTVIWATCTMIFQVMGMVCILEGQFAMPQFIRNAIDTIAGPTTFFIGATLGFAAMIAFRRYLANGIVAWGIVNAFLLFFGLSMTDFDFREIVTKPDNVPIVGMLILVGYFTWISLRRAVINDERMARGLPNLEELEPDKVLTWPDLVYTELIAMVVQTVVLIAWAILLKAPLEQPASSTSAPNPSKAPWYFLGLQEMLVYFDPWMAGVVLPSLIIVGLMAIPYIDTNKQGNGYYTYVQRKFAYITFQYGFLVLWVMLIILGTFLRGPNWNFFGPYEYWDLHRVNPLNNVNLSEIFWIQMLGRKKPDMILLREAPGLLISLAYFMVLPPLMGRLFFKKIIEKGGMTRYLVMAFLLLFMASLPIKMVLRWTINLKYLVAIPEFFFNI